MKKLTLLTVLSLALLAGVDNLMHPPASVISFDGPPCPPNLCPPPPVSR